MNVRLLALLSLSIGIFGYTLTEESKSSAIFENLKPYLNHLVQQFHEHLKNSEKQEKILLTFDKLDDNKIDRYSAWLVYKSDHTFANGSTDAALMIRWRLYKENESHTSFDKEYVQKEVKIKDTTMVLTAGALEDCIEDNSLKGHYYTTCYLRIPAELKADYKKFVAQQ